jgi:hypothetical protein
MQQHRLIRNVENFMSSIYHFAQYGKIKRPYLLLIIIQLLIASVAFIHFRMNPTEVLFCNFGDGIKNCFTLQAYVQSPITSKGLFHFYSFNYPYGEYVVTADNTPLFAIALRWFSHYIYDISRYTIPLYNLCVVFSFVLTALISFKVLRLILKNDFLSFVTSIVFSWTNMQTIRLWRGHYNLSFAFLIVLTLLLFWLWSTATQTKRKLYIAIAFIALMLVSFLIHGYYIAIIGLFIGFLLLFWGGLQYKTKEGKVSLLAAVAVPAIGVFLSLLFLKITDGFYAYRQPGAAGYDWMMQKARFGALLTNYDFYSIFFPINLMGIDTREAEQTAFLGNVGLYILLFLVVLSVFSKSYRAQIILHQKAFFKQPLTAALLLASTLMLIVNFGEHYYTEVDETGWLIYNFLNPIYWLHQFSDSVTQFRSLARFAWPFFWGFNIWMLYSLLQLMPQIRHSAKYLVVPGILFLSIMEIKDFVDTIQSRAHGVNMFSPTALKHYNTLQHINPDKYQALLALPYYHVGTEKGIYTLDDNSDISTPSFQYHLISGLPLINVKLSRTVPQQADSLFHFLAGEDSLLTPSFQARWNSKPILIMRDKTKLQDSTMINQRPEEDNTLKAQYWKILQLPERYHLTAIDSIDNIVFYEWQIAP